MANNRLYIGNKETKECYCLSKSGDSWRPIGQKELKGINEILETDNTWQEKTNLILFTESDNEWYNFFFKKPQ